MKLSTEVLSLLCDPQNHEAFQVVEDGDGGEELRAPLSEHRFPLRSGIPILLQRGDVTLRTASTKSSMTASLLSTTLA